MVGSRVSKLEAEPRAIRSPVKTNFLENNKYVLYDTVTVDVTFTNSFRLNRVN